MTPERFNECLDAYGADLRRWPQDEYAAARDIADNASPALRARMSQEAARDVLLDLDMVPAPDETLILRIAAGAPARRRVNNLPSESWWRPRGTWPASVAGIGLAGSLAGAFFVSVAVHHVPLSTTFELMERGTAFSAVPADWSGE